MPYIFALLPVWRLTAEALSLRTVQYRSPCDPKSWRNRVQMEKSQSHPLKTIYHLIMTRYFNNNFTIQCSCVMWRIHQKVVLARFNAHRLRAVLRLHQVCYRAQWALSRAERRAAAHRRQIQTRSKVRSRPRRGSIKLTLSHNVAASYQKKMVVTLLCQKTK